MCYLKFQRLIVAFVNFTLEECLDCRCDSVAAYDGDSTDAPLLGRVCGGHGNRPPPFTATRSSLYLVFTSDANEEFPGFAAAYGSSDDGNLLVSKVVGHSGTSELNYTA